MSDRLRSNTFGYGLSLIAFGVIVGSSALLTAYSIKINFTIPVVMGTFVVAWYAGRWPGMVYVVLIWAVSVYSNPLAPEASVATWLFGHFTILALFVFIVLLISGRKQVDVKVRDSEERYRLLFENNPFPMWVYDPETLQFLAVNDAACGVYGYSRKEFHGMLLKDLHREDDVEAVVDIVSNLTVQINGPRVWKHRKKNGEIVDMEIMSHTIVFDGRNARLVLASDISERLLADEKLRRGQEQLAGVIASAMDAIISVDRGQKIVLFNGAAEKIFRYPADEAIGQSLDKFIPHRFRDAHIKHLTHFGQTKVTRRAMGALGNLFGLRSDGVEFPIEASISQIDTDGEKIYTVILRDITERKQAEDRNRRLNETLEQRVKDRTAQFEAANKEIEAFSYSVSHDLRAPLRAIDGFSKALLADGSSTLSDEGKGHLNEVLGATREMAKLIEDILQLSRVSRGELQREAVDLATLAKSIVTGLQKVDVERAVSVRIEDGLVASGDRGLLKVMLRNLLGNAWKFTSQRQRAEIAFGREEQEGQPVYFIRDNGAGFDMAYADRLFGTFERLHNGNDFAGSGIGLATVKRIVGRHGGRVWATGEVNAGATVYFTIPDGTEFPEKTNGGQASP